jgi:hypothetical protein
MAHATPAPDPIRGIARNVTWHAGPDESQILTFRVEVVDDVGNVERHVPVEGLYAKVSGILADGDDVEVEGPVRDEGTLDPTLIRNVKTGALLAGVPKGRRTKYVVALCLPFVLAIVGLAGGPEGAITGFLGGAALCILAWVVMAAFDRRGLGT